MKKIFVTGLLLAGMHAHATGAISGGGGKGVVCRDPSGAIASAQTLDIYEGRVLYGLNIPVFNKVTMETQLNHAFGVIPKSVRPLIEGYAKSVQQNMRLVHGVELQPVDDALVVALPQGCQAEQLANYFSDTNILVNGDIWDRMTESNRAALILHEAVYKAARLYGATDSQRSRHVVASLFDPGTVWNEPQIQMPQNGLKCFAKGNYFVAYPQGDSWVLNFQVLGGHIRMSETQGIIFGSNGEFDLTEAKTFPIVKGEDRIGSSTKMSMTISSNFEDGDLVTITKRWEALKDYNSGQVIPGYQMPKYYISWLSQNYPSTSVEEQPLNCSVQTP
ncbi:MAG: hypothetical protein JSU04_11975 [Bdellovibrionales bacterium]|nr:hypothetical protein [Bdellovibrionales bacterium]